jgi:glycosyltransferase involved in cell wall biosynthesis
MLRNKSLQNVLSLDPFFPEFAAQRYRGGGKVVALPDPVYRQILQPALRQEVDRDRPRKHFLLFGHITERKGVLVLLQALERLRPEIAAQVEIILAGSIEDSIRPAVLSQIESLKQRQPQLAIQIQDRRLDSAELQAQVDAADAILAPYQRFVGSSGVLLWAANSGKPVVTQNFGLLGRLVRDHRLGITVDTAQPGAIAAALEHIVALPDMEQLFDKKAAADFVAQRSPERFAAEIFGH